LKKGTEIVQIQSLMSALGLAATQPRGEDRGGRAYLARRSWLIKHAGSSIVIQDVIVVDDNAMDTGRMASALRLVFGREISVRTTKTAAGMVTMLRAKHPDLLIVDDFLSQSQRAETTIAAAEAQAYAGPVLVVTGLLTRQRLVEIKMLGVVDIIHKDDFDSARLREAVRKITDVEPDR
jgi:DNA-binding NarL/FixJ family response regulator